MKTLVLTLGLLAACVRAGYAVEYVTLTLESPTVSLSPRDIVERVGFSGLPYNSGFSGVFAQSEDGLSINFNEGGVITGVVSISVSGSAYHPGWATLKITRANEQNAVAPTSLLIIPENSTGNYNIVVETSSDTATWTPFHSQTVSANDAKRFFRTRIVRAE